VSLAIDLGAKVVLLTGGSRGIGAAAVRALHEAGARVFFCYRQDEAEARRLEARLGANVAGRRCDIADPDALPPLVTECVDRFGRIDVLVNNAGTIARAPAAEHGDLAWDGVLEVNLTWLRYVGAALSWWSGGSSLRQVGQVPCQQARSVWSSRTTRNRVRLPPSLAGGGGAPG